MASVSGSNSGFERPEEVYMTHSGVGAWILDCRYVFSKCPGYLSRMVEEFVRDFKTAGGRAS